MKLLGGVLFFLGLSAMWFGASVMFYGGVHVAHSVADCKAICRVAMGASSVLGPVAGQVLAGGLTFALGLALALLGRARYQD